MKEMTNIDALEKQQYQHWEGERKNICVTTLKPCIPEFKS